MVLSVFWMIILLFGVKAETCFEVKNGIYYSCKGKNISHVPAIHFNTQRLDLSFNYFTSLNCSLFPQLSHLQELDLTRCQIQHIGDDAFQNVRSITTLILTGNPIDGLSNNTFILLTGLQRLVLVNTGLLSIEDIHLCHSTKLQELNVGANHLYHISIPVCISNFTEFKKLDLHANNISVIRKDHAAVLRQMRNNITLILSRNPIIHIEIGAFQNIYLQELQLLDAFTTPNATDNLKALVGLTVEKLAIGHFAGRKQIRSYICGVLDALCLINFREIYFYQFRRAVEKLEFRCLEKATIITFVHVDYALMENAQLLKTKELNLINARLYRMPASILHHKTLERLSITGNYRSFLCNLNFEEMPSLKYMDLSNNAMEVNVFTPVKESHKIQFLNLSINSCVYINAMGLGNLSNLEMLDFHHTKLITIGDYPTMSGLTSLSYLDLSYTSTTFTNTQTLMGLLSLRVLKMSGNNFHRDVLQHLFVNLTLLETLDISSCGIQHLPLKSFSNLKKLQYLLLSDNKLVAPEFLKYSDLLSLTQIDLAKNHVSSIPADVLLSLPKTLKVFEISFNPIDCSCSQAHFLIWIMEHRNIVKNDNICRVSETSGQSRISDFNIGYCTHIVRAKVTAAIFVVVFLLIMSALVYKFHFYLRYCCVLMKGHKASAQQGFLYDAFVIYSSNDEAWVIEELAESLEKGVPPFKLCLHERDFEVGKSIISNIIEKGFMGSQKVIVVVSHHFIDSNWCRFEFEMAQSWQLLQGNSNIIIIILEDVEEDRAKKVFGLHKYLRKNTYLKWNDNPISTVMFWSRLRKAIM